MTWIQWQTGSNSAETTHRLPICSVYTILQTHGIHSLLKFTCMPPSPRSRWIQSLIITICTDRAVPAQRAASGGCHNSAILWGHALERPTALYIGLWVYSLCRTCLDCGPDYQTGDGSLCHNQLFQSSRPTTMSITNISAKVHTHVAVRYTEWYLPESPMLCPVLTPSEIYL